MGSTSPSGVDPHNASSSAVSTQSDQAELQPEQQSPHNASSSAVSTQPDQAESQPEEPDMVEGWRKYWLNKPVIAGLIFFIGLLTGAADLKEHIWKLLDIDQKNTLALEKEGKKAEISRRLVELAWKRLFWGRDYLALRERDVGTAAQDAAWTQYIAASAEWNSELMIFINALQLYYPKPQRGGSKKVDVFQGHIQPCFTEVGKLLVDVRYLGAEDTNTPPPKAEIEDRIATARANIDALNRTLYFFALDEDQPTPKPSSSTRGESGTPQDSTSSGLVKNVCVFPYEEPNSAAAISEKR